ncbi:hypothetical protein KAI36_03736 [Paenibacillus sp. S02]|nr:hypothetical protein KAI36_03736 [Paenibacillus sp. S02]
MKRLNLSTIISSFILGLSIIISGFLLVTLEIKS